MDPRPDGHEIAGSCTKLHPGAFIVSTRKPPPKTDPAQLGLWSDLREEDRQLFEREFADVEPLRKGGDRIVLESSGDARGVAGPGAKRASSEEAALAVDHQDGTITGASHGVSHETLRALARGDIRAQSTCDLHGLGAEAARRKIQQFVRQSSCAGQRAVLVICGRGLHSGGEGSVLREVTIDELCSRQARAHVLAFSTASPARGGDGALAILLRRPAKST
jgi:DNA-nicking Smr family endonuclease